MGCLFCGLGGHVVAPRGLELNKGVLLALDLGLKVGRGQLHGGGDGEQGDERGEDGLHRGECRGLWAEQHTEPVRKRGVGCGGAGRLGGWPRGWAAGGSRAAWLCAVISVGVRGEGFYQR